MNTMSMGAVKPAVELRFTNVEAICFAMECAGIPLIQELSVTNVSEERLEGLELAIRILPELGAEQRVAIPALAPGERRSFDAIDVRLEPGKLRAFVEREAGELVLCVRRSSEVLVEERRRVDILPFNQWPGNGAPLGVLASFVLPNEPSLSPLLRAIGDELLRATREAAILAYQAQSLGRARAEVTAAYGCVRAWGIGYIGVPPSYENSGQKVRLVEAVLAEKLANCLDASLLYASVFEAMGFGPVLVLLDTHAFCGVWLEDDRFPEGVVEDAARLRTLQQLGSLCLFDASTALSGGSFGDAQAVAQNLIRADERFVAAADVRALRRARFLPLPIRADRFARDAAQAASFEALGRDNTPGDFSARPERGADAEPETTTRARFRRWKESLLDLTLRNRLLNFRLSGSSALRLDVPDAGSFEDLLAADRAFQVLPRPSQSPVRNEALLARRDGEAAELKQALLQDLAKGILYAGEHEDELWERALTLDRAARRDLEEGGATTLFAAIGLLRWFEAPDATEARLAPLLLYPVKLDFDRKTRRLKLRREGDDPLANQTLIEKVRQDFQIDLSAIAALEQDESGISVPALLQRARAAIQQMPRWEVLEEVHLGLFTFSKFLMWKDLHENTEQLLQNRVVRRIADGNPSATPSPPFRIDPATLDSSLVPAELPCVLDVDGTQLAAVAAALEGHDFVLQGPPGTGKSQTISTLIAAALGRGKTVLFVSEKMAALEVVYRRLRDVGLADFCLELHSHKTNKKDVLASFKAVLERPAKTLVPEWERACSELAVTRGHLNDYVAALHAPTPLGRTYHQVAARLRELEVRPDLEVWVDRIGELPRERYDDLRGIVARFADVAARVSPAAEHPWRASTRTELNAAEEQSLASLLARSGEALARLEREFAGLAHTLGYTGVGTWEELDLVFSAAEALVGGVDTLDREWQAGPVARAVHHLETWSALSARAQEYAERRRSLEARVRDLQKRWNAGFFDLDLPALSAKFEQHADSLFAWFRLRAPKRLLSTVTQGKLPETAQLRVDLRSGVELPRLRQELNELEQWVSAGLADVWAAVRESPDSVVATLGRSERFRDAWQALARLPGAGRLELSDVVRWRTARAQLAQQIASLQAARDEWRQLEAALRTQLQLAASFWPAPAAPGARGFVLDWVRHWPGQLGRLRQWCHYNTAKATMEASGLGAFVAAHAQGLRAHDLPETFEVSLLRRWRLARLDESPTLREFVAEDQSGRVARFAELDERYLAMSRARVIEVLEQKLPRRDSALKGSPLSVLQRELERRARHMAVRKLLGEISEIRAKLKPCMLMSPLSVAQYLPPDAAFDLVVFDEASQIETHDAIGAIARGRQVVIVGDSKQLPPTRFFSRRGNDEAPSSEVDVEDLDSILAEAVAKGLPQLTLDWHYRSRHETLIEFSNVQYYDTRLQIFPAARRYVDDLGVTWHSVPPGTYQPGEGPSGRTNPTEARLIVEHLKLALKTYAPGQRTFGVVTFSLSQMKLIERLLEEAREADPSLEPHFQGTEGVFVKNLENVQGDERDEILFSICYGPHAVKGKDGSTRPTHNFGALNLKGGERRLNVAVTRARKQLRVFSSMTHHDIDVRKLSGEGGRHLRRFLEFAADRSAARTRDDAKPRVFDSVVEREIHDELVRAGFAVHTKVGAGRYQLDLAVVHPADPRVYALAIESDGSSYRDAVVARDRDRLRGVVLRNMLWRTERVWSPEWLNDRDSALARVKRAVTEAVATAPVADSEPSAAPSPAAAPLEVGEPPEDLTPSPLPAEAVSAPAAAPSRQYPGEVTYATAALTVVSTDPDELYRTHSRLQVRDRLLRLVETEAPIHRVFAFRRVVDCWSFKRMGSRAHDHLDEIVTELSGERLVHRESDFLWRSQKEVAGYSQFRRGGPEGRPRDVDHIAPRELANALGAVLVEALSVPEDELIRETARMLGIERIGSRVGPALRRGLDLLLEHGRCEREGQRVRWLGADRPVPARQPPAQVATMPTASVPRELLTKLLSRPTVRQRLAAARVSEEQLTQAVTLLLDGSGRASSSELALRLGMPQYRLAGFVANLGEVLNVDGYRVVQLSPPGDSVELNREVLRQAFGLDAPGN